MAVKKIATKKLSTLDKFFIAFNFVYIIMIAEIKRSHELIKGFSDRIRVDSDNFFDPVLEDIMLNRSYTAQVSDTTEA